MDKNLFVWASFVFGVGLLVCIVWELVALARKRKGAAKVGRAPFFVGSVCIAGLLFAVIWPVFASAEVSAKMGKQRTLLKGWYRSLLMYAADNGDRLPPAKNWSKLCTPYWNQDEQLEDDVKPTLADPCSGENPGIAMNLFFSGKSITDDDWDGNIVMLAAGRWFENAVTDGNYKPVFGEMVLDADGLSVVSAQSSSVKWRPK